jgi:hypothetical protein
MAIQEILVNLSELDSRMLRIYRGQTLTDGSFLEAIKSYSRITASEEALRKKQERKSSISPALFIEKWRWFVRVLDNDGRTMPKDVIDNLQAQFIEDAKEVFGSDELYLRYDQDKLNLL